MSAFLSLSFRDRRLRSDVGVGVGVDGVGAARGRAWLRRASIGLAAALLLAPLPGLAGEPPDAQPADAPPPDASDQSKVLHERGIELLKQGEIEPARAALQAALDIQWRYATAGALGTAELKLKRYRDAATHLADYLREAPASTSIEERTSAADLLQQAKAHVGELKIAVSVAKVLVDRTVVGTSPLDKSVFVEPGTHDVTAEGPGGEQTMKVTIAEGEAHSVDLGAGGKAPDEGGGTNAAIAVPLFLVAGGTLAAAIGVTVVAGDKKSAMDEQSQSLKDHDIHCATSSTIPECVDLNEAAESADSYNHARIPLWIVGGLATVGALTYVAVAESSSSSSTVAVTPVFGPAMGGLQVFGSF